MNRNSDGPRLVGDSPSDGLSNPPGCVRAELIASLVFKFVDGFHQTNVALLDEVEKLQSAIGVLLGDTDDQPEISLYKLCFGSFSGSITHLNGSV